MADPRQPEEVAPAALEIAQVVGVVDDAGEVGVLVIDAHGQLVLAADDHPGIGLAAHSNRSGGGWPTHLRRSSRPATRGVPRARVAISAAPSGASARPIFTDAPISTFSSSAWV